MVGHRFSFEWLSERGLCAWSLSLGVLGPHSLGTKPRLRAHEVPHCLPLLGGSCPAADPLPGLHISAGSAPSPTPCPPHTFLAWGKCNLPQGREMRSRDAAELSHSHCHFFFADAAPQSHPRYLNPLLWVWLSLSSLESSDVPQALAPLASSEGLGVFIVPVPWKSQI